MMGDFNSIRREEDKPNCVYNSRDTDNYNQFMEEIGLIELEGMNYSYTWFGPKDKKSRLDRVVVNELWLSTHNWKVIVGHMRNSDHSPLIMFDECVNWGPKPFREFDDWLKMKEAQDVIDNVVNDSMQRSFFGTLKEFKLRFKSWHTGRGASLDSEIISLDNELQKMDKDRGDV